MTRFTAMGGIALLALLSVAVFVFGDGRAAVSTVSAAGHGDDDVTRAYVNEAIEYYADKGLSKTVSHYGNPLSWEDGRYLVVADAQTQVLVSSPLLYLNGKGVDALVPGGGLGDEIDKATDTGHWFDGVGLNMLSGEVEAARYFVRLENGLAFMSARFGDLDTPLPDPPTAAEPDDDAVTLAYVMDAIERYEREGLEATVAYYNSEDSVEGERGLRIYDIESQTMLASGLFAVERGEKRLSIGSLAELVKFFEGATEEARWLDIVGHDRNFQDVPKRVVAVLHEGLVFSASHVTLQENVAEATKHYVSRAIERYESEGLDATVAYYNSQESLEGTLLPVLHRRGRHLPGASDIPAPDRDGHKGRCWLGRAGIGEGDSAGDGGRDLGGVPVAESGHAGGGAQDDLGYPARRADIRVGLLHGRR